MEMKISYNWQYQLYFTMIELLKPLIFIMTALVLISVVILLIRKGKPITATLADKQILQDQCFILTFLLPKNKNTLKLKIGQQVLIKTHPSSKGKKFTPIQDNIGSFKILVIPNPLLDSQGTKFFQELAELNKGAAVLVSIVGNNLQYAGNGQIWIKNPSKNETWKKQFPHIYVLAQGNKITTAYQILKGICQRPSQTKPHITVLFIGQGIGDFALKPEFEQLEENNNNLSFMYSLPVKGERQPTLEGMGISSEKISETFASGVEETFCIVCAENNDICVTGERSLLAKGVPAKHIYKY